jgi:hypothetical protein
VTSTEEAATQNTATNGSMVGIQAEQVHNSNVYQVFPDSSPSEKYKIGVRFLKDGVPARARDLISEAIAHGYEDGEVRFHWVLAMLSKRAYRDLSAQEREQLSRIPDFLGRYAEDEWKRALEAIHELLERQPGSGGDPGPAIKAVRALHWSQRDLVVRHLDLVITGVAKDSLWAETREAALTAQLGGDRVNRVWAYFQPNPIEARARKPAMISTVPSDWGWAITSTALLMAAAVYFGRAVLASATPLPVLAYLVAFGAGYVAFRNGLEWHYRALQRRAKERAHSARYGVDPRAEGGFAARVDESFTHYFAKYAPDPANRDKWLAATAGIRAAMRDEIVDLYRESRISIGRVNWLIRYLVGDVKRRWGKETLRGYRERWRTRPVTKLCCMVFSVVLVLAVTAVVVVATRADPIWGTLVAVVLFVSGRAATVRWSRIICERWRYDDDYEEYEQVLADRQAAYQRWWDKLESARPAEQEMETWLTCDKTMLLDTALRHYKLALRDVIVHSFLQTPAGKYKRARMSGCPWRYSRYDMRLFLITQDGVREYRTEFDFEHVSTMRNERNNFRFDAVSSVGVVRTSELSYTLKLTLSNGPASDIRITDETRHQPDADENPEKFSEINLDAAGFKPTLHILEGIAAEGKGWLERDSHACSTSAGPWTAIDDF